MLDQYYIAEKLRNCELPADTQDLVITIIDGIMALAARAANSNSDSNSLGGILIHPLEREMPKVKPRTKAPKEEQLGRALQGELATYKRVGLFQRSLGKKTASWYRSVLLQCPD